MMQCFTYNNSIYLHILFSVAPQILSPLSTTDANFTRFGDDVTLMCISDGGPNNSFEWSKDGVVLTREINNTLTLSFITASSGGVYTCSVSNAAGNDSASTTLYVAPYIVTPLQELTLTKDGLVVNTSCDAAGFPSPVVNWMNMANVEVSSTSLLQFNPVMFGDEGMYRCSASSLISGTELIATNVTILTSRLISSS